MNFLSVPSFFSIFPPLTWVIIHIEENKHINLIICYILYWIHMKIVLSQSFANPCSLPFHGDLGRAHYIGGSEVPNYWGKKKMTSRVYFNSTKVTSEDDRLIQEGSPTALHPTALHTGALLLARCTLPVRTKTCFLFNHFKTLLVRTRLFICWHHQFHPMHTNIHHQKLAFSLYLINICNK